MASGDARPVPRKNVAYRVTFPVFDADGDLVTSAGSLDSEISKDAGTFADCTNEATEIATASGMYYLDLTSTEMNADTVAIIVKSTGGKTTAIVLYPEEVGDYRIDETNLATAAALATVDSNVDDILTDTGTTLDGKLNTIAGYLDTEVAAILAAVDTEVGAIKTVTDGLNAQLTTIDSNVDAILVDTGTDIPASIDALPTAAENATAVMGSTIEGSLDLTEMQRLFAAALLGKASGLATTTATFRDTGDSKDRIVATVDASGNRSAVTLDAS